MLSLLFSRVLFANSVNIIENSVLDLFSMVFLMFSFSSFFLPFGS